jgi:DNA-binding transcriptional LysR family regulator
MGRPWRVAYCVPSFAAVRAVVMAGLAVGMFGQSVLPPGALVLGPEQGFPALPPSMVTLHRAPGEASEAARVLAEHVGASLRAQERAGSRAA